jgi:hypothetical protein
MFHPNVYADGGICLDILQNRWSPTYDVSAILTSIQSLLDEPNPNSPANSVAAQLYQENREEIHTISGLIVLWGIFVHILRVVLKRYYYSICPISRVFKNRLKYDFQIKSFAENMI